jgi:phosphoribosylformylglycinamidine cyclo-ligase
MEVREDMVGYKEAGVDIEAGYKAVELIQEDVKRTFIPGVLGGIGGFGGMFELDVKEMKAPVLVSGTDGVGTKLKISFMLNQHATIGIDCVAMCVNDIVCSGAKPLFFMDYIALEKNVPEKVAEIVAGMAEGCISAGCALVGGETAEMPGFYAKGEYDVAGFAVGVVEKDKIIDGKNIALGDTIIGLASSGLHSNGYSLVRKILNLNKDAGKLHQNIERLGKTIGEELLIPTRIYVKTILDLISKYPVKGMAHITGGGFLENIPRILPQGLRAKIVEGSWPKLPIFELLQDLSDLNQEAMYNTFNLGIGMVLVVGKNEAQSILDELNRDACQAYRIGEIIAGARGVEI